MEIPTTPATPQTEKPQFTTYMKKLLIALCCSAALQATAQTSITVDSHGKVISETGGNGYTTISGKGDVKDIPVWWTLREDTLILKTDKVRFIKIGNQTYEIIRNIEIRSTSDIYISTERSGTTIIPGHP